MTDLEAIEQRLRDAVKPGYGTRNRRTVMLEAADAMRAMASIVLALIEEAEELDDMNWLDRGTGKREPSKQIADARAMLGLDPVYLKNGWSA